MQPERGRNGTVSRAFPLIALIALGAYSHIASGQANRVGWVLVVPFLGKGMRRSTFQ